MSCQGPHQHDALVEFPGPESLGMKRYGDDPFKRVRGEEPAAVIPDEETQRPGYRRLSAVLHAQNGFPNLVLVESNRPDRAGETPLDVLREASGTKGIGGHRPVTHRVPTKGTDGLFNDLESLKAGRTEPLCFAQKHRTAQGTGTWKKGRKEFLEGSLHHFRNLSALLGAQNPYLG